MWTLQVQNMGDLFLFMTFIFFTHPVVGFTMLHVKEVNAMNKDGLPLFQTRSICEVNFGHTMVMAALWWPSPLSDLLSWRRAEPSRPWRATTHLSLYSPLSFLLSFLLPHSVFAGIPNQTPELYQSTINMVRGGLAFHALNPKFPMCFMQLA